jgi:hypothetical protein
MKRSDITGFTVKLFGYSIEVVLVKHIPAVLAINHHNNLIKRFES